MQIIKNFIEAIDRLWQWPQDNKIRLRIIGSTALMLQTDYERGTKDSDVLETELLSGQIKDRLLVLAGINTKLHDQHKIYLDIVSNSLPFLPQIPSCHFQDEFSASLAHFEVEVLDIVDVVISKLKRFSPNDVSDIQAMADKELIDHRKLIARFQLAVDAFSMDARAPDLPKYIDNLHRVERDHLFVSETPIELPAWIAEE